MGIVVRAAGAAHRRVRTPAATEAEVDGAAGDTDGNPGARGAPGEPRSGDSKESLAGVFAAEFREFGSSGRAFDAETVLGALGGVAQRPSRAPISLEGFRAEKVAPNVVLATYLARVPAGPGWRPPTLRSSLWCKRDGRWQIMFHQGTPVPAASAPDATAADRGTP